MKLARLDYRHEAPTAPWAGLPGSHALLWLTGVGVRKERATRLWEPGLVVREERAPACHFRLVASATLVWETGVGLYKSASLAFPPCCFGDACVGNRCRSVQEVTNIRSSGNSSGHSMDLNQDKPKQNTEDADKRIHKEDKNPVLLHNVKTPEEQNNLTEQHGGARVGIIEEYDTESNAHDEADHRHDTSDNTRDRVVASEDMGDGANNECDQSKIQGSLSPDMNVCDEEEKNLVVLDPDHPLMKRFQVALRSHLTKQVEQLDLVIKELEEDTQKRIVEREETGRDMFGKQQELAKIQARLERLGEECIALSDARAQHEKELKVARERERQHRDEIKRQYNLVSTMRAESDGLALKVLYTEGLRSDMEGKAAIMLRTMEKGGVERHEAEKYKKEQDLHVDRLTQQALNLEEKTEMLNAQMEAQVLEKNAIQEAASEARMESEALAMEKKELLQQWNSSIVGMRNRDETFMAAQEALEKRRQDVSSLDTELAAYKRLIQQEEERNGKLVLELHRTEGDAAMAQGFTAKALTQQEVLRIDGSNLNRILQETQDALSNTTAERVLKTSTLENLSKQIAQTKQQKAVLDEQIMEASLDQLVSDKETQDTRRRIQKLRARAKELELEQVRVENDAACLALQTNEAEEKEARMKQSLAALQENINQQNLLITQAEAEQNETMRVVQQKQVTIEQNMKKMEKLLIASRGEDLGPLQIQVKQLHRNAAERQTNIEHLQRQWLQKQSELLKLVQKREEQAACTTRLRTRVTVLQQRRLRVENELEQQRREESEAVQRTERLRSALQRLSHKLHAKKGLKEELLLSNSTLAGDSMDETRDNELHILELEEQVDQVRESGNTLTKSIIEAQQQLMLWEKKTILTREAYATIDSDYGKGEIQSMRSEIHRMQVCYSQLKRQQMDLTRDMEAAVSRRESITMHNEVLERCGSSTPTQTELHRKLGEMSRAIRSAQKDATSYNTHLTEMQEAHKVLGTELARRQEHVNGCKVTSSNQFQEAQQMKEKKIMNLAQIVAWQARAKVLQTVLDGSHRKLCSSPDALCVEHNRQDIRLRSTSILFDRICSDFPQLIVALQPIKLHFAALPIQRQK
uniref:coiled-coil domain-containing protein 40 n=1 Tax=Myxine glutinosa TaxID=7769 RepID=UPI00358F7869